MNEQWTLAWSARQNALHVETMSGLLHRNRQALASGKGAADYALIAIGTQEQMERAAADLHPVLQKREAARERATL